MIFLLHECRQNRKMFLIWALSLGLICYGCILLYQSVASQLTEVADFYANMGGITKALGMDKISLATLDGYYATEIGLMFGLGAGMFEAMLGVTSLSKEEEGHTSEFLYTLPHHRSSILLWKFLSILLLIFLFNLLVVGINWFGLWQLDMDFSLKFFLRYHFLSLLMQVEIASLCFLVSALSRKKQIGLAMGLVLLTYSLDMMVRLVPKLDSLSYLTPYYYANAASIFSGIAWPHSHLVLACLVGLISLGSSLLVYRNRDLGA